MKKRLKDMNTPDLYGRKDPDDIPGRHGGHIEHGKSLPLSGNDIQDVIQYALETIKRAADMARIGALAEARARRVPEPVYEPIGRPWCPMLGVTFLAPTATKRTLSDLGGSKVGENLTRLGPTGSAPGQGGCNQALTEAISGAWKRTFGRKTHVGVQDLEFFPHLTGSHWVPLGPGPSAGNRDVGPLDWVPTFREGPSPDPLTGGVRTHSKSVQDRGPSRHRGPEAS